MAEQLITFEYEDHEGQNQTFDMYVQDIGDTYEGYTPSEDPPTEPFEMSTTVLRLSDAYSGSVTHANPYCCWFKPGESETYLYGPTPIHSSWYSPDNVGWPNINNPNWRKVSGFQNKINALAAYMLSSGASDRDPNIIKLTDPTDRSKMFYDGDEMGETIPTGANRWVGQLMYYVNDDGERQTARFSWYIRNDSTSGDDPVYRVYFGGPHTFTSYGMTRTNESVTTFNENDPPALGFWRVPLKCDIDEPYPTNPASTTGRSGGDGEHYGETINVIVMIYRSNGNVTVGIVPEFIFHSIDAPQETTDSPEETNVTPSGWTGNWDFSSDFDVPKTPTGFFWANQWEHGIHIYNLTSDQVEAFFYDLWYCFTIKDNIIAGIKGTIVGRNLDWIQGIITLHVLPCTVGRTGDEQRIHVFGNKLDVSKGRYIAKNSGQHVVQLTSKPLEIPHTIDDNVFLDYDNCSAYIMLPFVGKVPIDVKAFRGGALLVEYKIDILTGNCIAQVFATSKKLPGTKFGDQSGKQILVYQGAGNCAIHIPYIGNTEGGFKQLQALTGVGMAAIGAATGTAPITMAGAASAVNSMMPTGNTESHSYIASEVAPLMHPDVKLVIEGPFPQIPKRQRLDWGYKAFGSAKISDFRKYPGRNTKESPQEFLQGKVHANIDVATDAEKEAIERLFEEGVMV